MQEHYKDDTSLRDIAKPSEIRETSEAWIVYYDDKEGNAIRLPSGVELRVDKATGKVERINLE